MSSRTLSGAAAVLLVGLVATLALPSAVGRAWLAATFVLSGVAVGSIGFLLMMRLIGGTWREALAPSMARGAATLPLLAAAVLPVLIAMGRLYPWVAAPMAAFQGAWLQPWAFVLRTAVWLLGLAAAFHGLSRWPNQAAVIGLLFLVPMGSLVAVDWLMSLDPTFHASGFGLQMLAVQYEIALMVAVLRQPADATGTTGALMLTLLMLWGYFAYLGFFIIWSGNLPAGAAWYLVRGAGGWGWVAGASALFHAVPLLALLSGQVRRSALALRLAAAAALVGDGLFAAWLVLPVDGPVHGGSMIACVAALAVMAAAAWPRKRAR